MLKKKHGNKYFPNSITQFLDHTVDYGNSTSKTDMLATHLRVNAQVVKTMQRSLQSKEYRSVLMLRLGKPCLTYFKDDDGSVQMKNCKADRAVFDLNHLLTECTHTETWRTRTFAKISYEEFLRTLDTPIYGITVESTIRHLNLMKSICDPLMDLIKNFDEIDVQEPTD
jgi:hypothetical protein